MEPEEQSISRLRSSSFQIEEDKFKALEEFFRQLRQIDDQVSCASPTELYESQWAFLGIVSRSYQLMLCCIDQIAGGNWNGFYAAARGLVETLCSVAWVNECSDRLLALVRTEKLSIGRMLNAGYRKYPEIKEAYSHLSSIVHPNRDSHLLGFRPVEERRKKGAMSPFNLTLSDYFAKRKVTLITEFASKINHELLELLSQKDNVLRQGKVMAQLIFKMPNQEP
jgi:hypothetical protein